MSKLTFAIVLALAVACTLAAPRTTKVTSSLEAKISKGLTANIIVSLTSTKNVLASINARSFGSRTQKIESMKASLEALAAETQGPVISALSSFPFIIIKSFWVSNQMYIANANADVVARLVSMDQVVEIHEEHIIPVPELINYSVSEGPSVNAEWGVNSIQAPAAWALGFEGAGSVISTTDTGARVSHQALAANYLGAGYGWFDPYQGTSAPNDQNGHGSHTTANIAGTQGVGVAPAAKWMACKGCSTSSCTEPALLACGQWTVCPTWSDGSNANCSYAPDLSSNSWGGGQGDEWYTPVTDAMIAAGVIPVFAIGNSGPLCSTANSPGDQEVISVGASTAANGLALFSSKGPSIDGTLKPDISAPGENIRSAAHTGDAAYSTSSGTSMACPHVSGVVALVKGFWSNISYEDIKILLYTTATKDLTPTARNCGGIDTSTFPNNSYGWGKVNALNVLRAAKEMMKARGIQQ